MQEFSIRDCVIFWDTRKEPSERTKEAIVRDLTGLSDTIGKALVYLKDTAMDKKFPEVRFPIGENWEFKVFLHVFDGPDPLYFRMSIEQSMSDENIAEIENQNSNIQTFVSAKNENYCKQVLNQS